MAIQISGRNQLRGRVTEVQLGDILASVTVQVGDNLIDAVITRRSAERLQLKVGDEVATLIKATEVMVVKEFEGS
ncbi:MAG: TOBE domain-containing protein [Cyanobacteria bacterium SID2]|nr:TOBE domain-containing protein [Cyanobacteria bacterium SID2]MBP0003009.1 TOBE domain-containing protein [Cyanobacteria bacterium SBC]